MSDQEAYDNLRVPYPGLAGDYRVSDPVAEVIAIRQEIGILIDRVKELLEQHPDRVNSTQILRHVGKLLSEASGTSCGVQGLPKPDPLPETTSRRTAPARQPRLFP